MKIMLSHRVFLREYFQIPISKRSFEAMQVGSAATRRRWQRGYANRSPSAKYRCESICIGARHRRVQNRSQNRSPSTPPAAISLIINAEAAITRSPPLSPINGCLSAVSVQRYTGRHCNPWLRDKTPLMNDRSCPPANILEGRSRVDRFEIFRVKLSMTRTDRIYEKPRGLGTDLDRREHRSDILESERWYELIEEYRKFKDTENCNARRFCRERGASDDMTRIYAIRAPWYELLIVNTNSIMTPDRMKRLRAEKHYVAAGWL